MKKAFIILLCSGFIFSCGSNTNSSSDKKTDSTTTQTTATSTAAADPEAKKGLQLIAGSDCLTCHKLNEASTGPAYALVAAKYKNDPSKYDTLAEKIIKGGSGNWGTIPMTAHQTLSKEDALSMVHYVMSVK